ncbi:glycosyltransferase [Streptomyces sp. PLK6-54]|uniref:D-inositol 3-phosphate glycosyltransferase n=1 Tax=Actinacidiphila acidipaludis TaxID=2873382 RepID=A0ABS7Q8N6_9ACTN|nr:glycosyltransferase [Streptomyces acidipaludis]
MLSIYEGFFSGGARILHSDVVLGLHGGVQRHAVLSVEGEMHREATRQPMEQDACYRALTAAGVPVSALRRGTNGPLVPGAGGSAFTADEVAATARATAAADVILSLKEQPLALLNQAGLPLRPVVVCLHRSDPENQGPALDALLAAVAAGRVRAVVCCAESTRRAYAAAGVPEELLHVIPNGVDLLRFRPDPAARARLRAALGVPAQAPVVVFAARWAAMKNVPLFLAAAREFLRRDPDARVVMCGAGMTGDNPGLRAEITAAVRGEPWLAERILLLGVRSDMEAVYAAGDVVALTSSSGEAAPLCLIEGMMCGAVPVATDVGDSALLVAGRGLLTQPDPAAIASAWSEAVARAPLFAPALEAGREEFSRTRMVAAYGALIEQVHRGVAWAPLPEPL